MKRPPTASSLPTKRASTSRASPPTATCSKKSSWRAWCSRAASDTSRRSGAADDAHEHLPHELGVLRRDLMHHVALAENRRGEGAPKLGLVARFDEHCAGDELDALR